MLFSLNQSVAISLSLFIVLNSFSKVHSCDEIELSSATLCSSDSLTRQNKSFIKILKIIGPSIDPWGTPNRTT